MSVPDSALAAVFLPAEGRFDIREFPLRHARAGEVLVKASLSTICGSDLHTLSGRRPDRSSSAARCAGP